MTKRLVRFAVLDVTLILCLLLTGCPKVEVSARDAIVGAKSFLDTEKKAHPECAAGTQTTVCSLIAQAVAAKDSAIDALEVYCAGPDFDNGGACNAPVKGTPAYNQVVAKLQAAITILNQFIADIKGVK